MQSSSSGRVGAALRLAEGALGVLSSLSLVLVMVLVSFDALLRYAVNSPISWVHDLVSIYLIAAIFYFALSGAIRDRYHASVDLFIHLAPRRVRHSAEVVSLAVSSVVFAVITLFAASQTLHAFQSGDTIIGIVDWPTWWTYLIVALGAFFAMIRSALGILGHAVSAVTGVDRAPLADLTEE